jgi:hypothetical protein
MRKVLTFAIAATVISGLSPADARAQVEVSGSVDVFYQYATNGVDPELRTFDFVHNSFTLGLAEVALEIAPTANSRVGGRVDLNFGSTADIVGSTDAVDDEIYKHIQQAYVSFMASESFTVDAGKFVTPIGAEVIESQDNWNYSRSILFGYAIPFNHVGVRGTMAANEQVSISGFVLNGWNNSVDNNSDKTFAASVSVAPNDQLSWIGNVIVGKEGDNDGDGEEDLLWLFDTTVSYALSDALSLMGNFDYGTNANAVPGPEDAKWWGIAAYLRYQAQEDWAVAGRVEYVDDSEGGFMTIGEKAQSFTVTSDHTLDDLIARLEFRLDRAESDTFFPTDDASDPFVKSQPSLTVGLVYPF